MNAKTFVLEIRLGNDAMQSWDDVAKAIKVTASRLVGEHALEVGERGKIYDDNGNVVGGWRAK
jgi:hypothetical protein